MQHSSKKWQQWIQFWQRSTLIGEERLLREGVKKTDLFGTLSQTMGRWVQSPKLFSENNHSVIFTANIQKCPKTCVIHFSFFQKIKCSKQPKQPGGWGPMFGTKSQINTFFLTPSSREDIN